MFSERSCDTEDWRNDAENSALITRINHTLYVHTHIIFFNNISQFSLYFSSNKCNLGEQKRHSKILPTPKF